MNVLPRRRRRIAVQRASSDEDGQVELGETVRFTKRRRVDWEDGSYREKETRHSSDEEGDDGGVHTQNRLFLPSGATLGFLVPRKARTGARRLHDCRDSEMRQPRASWPPTTKDEFEVAEALFDLMKQSYPVRPNPEMIYTDAHDVKDDEESVKVKVDEIVVDSVTEMKARVTVEKDKPQAEPVAELVRGHEPTSKTEVGSSVRENESLSCRINARDIIQDPTATSGYLCRNHDAPKLGIDLMAFPPLESSPERNLDVKREVEEIKQNGPSISSVAPHVPDERPGVSSYFDHLPNSCLRFPFGTSNWNLLQLHGVYTMDASAGSLTMNKLPQFKLPSSGKKRCTLHCYIASNIQLHQKLMSKCLVPANDHNLLQQTPADSHSIPCARGFIAPNRQRQVLASLPLSDTCSASLLSNSSVRPSVNLQHHPLIPPSEAAAFMALLQNNSYTVPISSSIALPQFKAPKASSFGGSLAQIQQPKSARNGRKSSASAGASPFANTFSSLDGEYSYYGAAGNKHGNICCSSSPIFQLLPDSIRSTNQPKSYTQQQQLQHQLIQVQKHLMDKRLPSQAEICQRRNAR